MTNRPATTQVLSVKYRESLSQNETRSSVLRSGKLRLRCKSVIEAQVSDGWQPRALDKTGGNRGAWWLM
ncbi:MAG: hypothetical protein CVT73_06020 [Alphaproteobacteria bacterium HGW-Alphaproteobacteria-12]|nr:MAG: hypothetical protein CVT73_06020 [Alphaproteobacteria bacterium HGW-Alphaproteobacteria-12]